MTLRAPGRGVLAGAMVVVTALVALRVSTRSGGPAFDDWFFLVLAAGLLAAAAVWARCRVDLVPGGVRVVNGLRTHHLDAADVTAVDVARVGDRGAHPRATAGIRVPICARLELGSTYLAVLGLAPDARTRRDPERWSDYLGQVDALARHLGVPVHAGVEGP